MRPTRARNAAGSGSLARLGQQCLWGLVIFAAVVVALNVLARLRLVVLPVLLAVVLATVLEPPVRWLRARGWHDGPAAVIVLLISLLVLASALAVIAPPIIDEFGDLDVGVSATLDQVQTWVRDSPLPISNDQISDGIDRLEDQVRTSLDAIAAQLLGGALVALEVLTAVALAVVVLFFLLKDCSYSRSREASSSSTPATKGHREPEPFDDRRRQSEPEDRRAHDDQYRVGAHVASCSLSTELPSGLALQVAAGDTCPMRRADTRVA